MEKSTPVVIDLQPAKAVSSASLVLSVLGDSAAKPTDRSPIGRAETFVAWLAGLEPGGRVGELTLHGSQAFRWGAGALLGATAAAAIWRELRR